MELTAGHAMQALMLIGTIAGGYAVVKNTLQRVVADLEEHTKKFEQHKSDFDTRLDDAESQRAVFTSQIDVLKDINSVATLERRNREIADIQARIKVMENQIQAVERMHNGSHPPVRIKDG